MSKENNNKKNNSIAIAIIGLVGTIVTAVFGSPVLAEWIKSQQALPTPQIAVTETAPIFTEQILIFREDFDNDTVSGFSYEGNWLVGQDKNNRILGTGEPGTATFGPSYFRNGIIEFRVRLRESAGNSGAAVSFRESAGAAYMLTFAEDQLVLGKQENDSFQAFDNETTRSLVFEKDVWYLIRIEMRGPEIIVFVDNNRIMSASDSSLEKGGSSFSTDAGIRVDFDDVKMWDLR